MTGILLRRSAALVMIAIALPNLGCVTANTLYAARGGMEEGAPASSQTSEDSEVKAGSEESGAGVSPQAEPRPAMYALVPFAVVADILLIPFWIVVTILVNMGLMEEPF